MQNCKTKLEIQQSFDKLELLKNPSCRNILGKERKIWMQQRLILL